LRLASPLDSCALSSSGLRAHSDRQSEGGERARESAREEREREREREERARESAREERERERARV
tara:strand:+ start:250 stop:444 length:195 start_codon:yes stop_codon:yes gene_type:complete